MFFVSISLEDDKILGSFVADSYFFEPSKYDYAFYLYKDAEKIDTVWYTDSMKVVFNVKDMIGSFNIRVFVRDIEHGDKRTFDSEKISIQ